MDKVSVCTQHLSLITDYVFLFSYTLKLPVAILPFTKLLESTKQLHEHD